MASGLQCPGCGHVHPAGLPEIARGDAVFRCYGCYRALSVPEGWTGRPSPRPAPGLTPTDDAPPGAGTRDARAARLAARRGATMTRPPGPTEGGPATQASPVVSDAGPSPAPAAGRPPAPPGGYPPAPAAGRPPAPPGGYPPAAPGVHPPAPPGTTSGAGSAHPLGWVAPRRSKAPVPTAIRVAVWTAAFGFGLLVSAFVLRKVGALDIDTVIDLYAGTGPGRFGVLLALLPLWALVSAAVAHFSLEVLARRRRPRGRSAGHSAAGRSAAGRSTAG